MIEVGNVSKRYGRTQALDDISFDIPGQAFFALLGPNGAGKTTMLHILCSILRPDSGVVRIGGVNVVAQPTRARQSIGVVFQEPSLDDRLTVQENLNFHGLVYGVPARLRRQRISELLDVVELADTRDKLVRTLSTGIKRRLEIARALIHESRVLFLDEPTAGLDVQSRERIWQYIGQLRARRNLTVVVTTHYIEEVEACDRICIIDHGKIIAMDAPDAMRRKHGQQLLRIQPRDKTTENDIAQNFGDSIVRRGDEIIIKGNGDGFVETFLLRYGSRLRRLTVEDPTLESVFLLLTGREIRDQPSEARRR